ncbi:MAG: hypothetical protein HKN94_05705 [Acidimicrobiales bacterium]|nr:hypothetical protein [Acidimicrobiales bacterium]RZV46663.1 MAG: hypothetical protein EX269_06690 [Acidimicrobiales bacterium]
MTIEDRLRSELQRVAPRSVGAAPDIDLMQETVGRRRRRNTIATRLSIVVFAAVAIGGALIVTQPDDAGVVSTAAPDATADAPIDAAADADAGAVVDDLASDDASADEENVANPAPVNDPASVVTAPDLSQTEPAGLQLDPSSLNVAREVSAVQFAGGSGVFVVSTPDGYAGLASRFGGAEGVSAVGMRSDNGLAWTEVELSGLPPAAAATAVRQYGDDYVALLSAFDVAAQKRLNYLATSTDMSTWQTVVLPGDNLVATDVAVGPSGVIVVGDAPNPLVWVGELGGPYRRVGFVRGASSLAGVVAVDGGFVAAGTSNLGPQLFQSTDGVEWLGAPVTGVDGEDTLVAMTVMDGEILLAGSSEETTWTVTSSDGGQTWQRGEYDIGRVGSVASKSNTVTLLSSTSLGTTNLALSDGLSWSSVDLEFDGETRVNLLHADSDLAVLLADVEGELTWVVASR